MFEVEDWVEELIQRIMNTFGCTREQAMIEISKYIQLWNLTLEIQVIEVNSKQKELLGEVNRYRH